MDSPEINAALTKSTYWKWAKRAYILCIGSLLCWALTEALPTLTLWSSQKLVPALAALGTGWILMVLLLGRGWATSLHAWSGTQLSTHQWLPMQLAAWSGRYLPGKLGLVAGKLQACEHGVSWKTVTTSVLCEQGAFIASGATLSILALPYWIALAPESMQTTSQSHSTIFIVLAMTPVIMGGLFGMLTTRKGLTSAGSSWSIRLLGWSFLAHVSAGTGFHFFLRGLLDSPPTWLESIGLLAAAHTAGILAVFAPAGLGVREIVIATALAPQLGWPQAFAVSALQRGLVVLMDALLAVASLMTKSRSSN